MGLDWNLSSLQSQNLSPPRMFLCKSALCVSVYYYKCGRISSPVSLPRVAQKSIPTWNPILDQCVLLSRSTSYHNLSNLLNSQESGLKVNQPASFAIRLNGAKGKIDAKVHSPSGAVEECHVSELEPGKYQGWHGGLRISVSGPPGAGPSSYHTAGESSSSFCCH